MLISPRFEEVVAEIVTCANPLLPSAVAVMATGEADAATPVTIPVAIPTVATEEFDEVHEMLRPVSELLAASRSVAVSCAVPPTAIALLDGDTVTLATGGTEPSAIANTSDVADITPARNTS